MFTEREPHTCKLDMNLKSVGIIAVAVVGTGIFLSNGSNSRKSDELFNQAQAQLSGYGAPCMKMLKAHTLMLESRSYGNRKQKELANAALKRYSVFLKQNCSV